MTNLAELTEGQLLLVAEGRLLEYLNYQGDSESTRKKLYDRFDVVITECRARKG
jgi:hypothetical protein